MDKSAIKRLIHPFLFTDDDGAPLEFTSWHGRVWSKALDASGMIPQGLKIHDLRHTAASTAIAAGADVHVVQKILGHKDTTETLNTYSHLWPERLDEVMDVVSEHRENALERDNQAGLNETA